MAVTASSAVFWYGCNMTRHGEVVRLAQRLLAATGVDAAPAGGAAHCCGAPQEGNARIVEGMAARTAAGFAASGREALITWCPSCHLNLGDTIGPSAGPTLPARHITAALHDRIDRLRPLLTQPVELRVLVHAHAGFDGTVPVNTLVPDLLRLIPGLTVLEHPYRAPGHMCSALGHVPGALADAQRATLDAVRATGADALVTLFHSCHRALVELERPGGPLVINWVHLLATSAGWAFADGYKAWRNAPDPRAAVGEAGVAAVGEVAFARLVEPELRRAPVLAG